MGELSSNFNIKDNNIDQKLTFDELSKQKITSQQLYIWSAPIDLIENYQFYLNQLENSEKTTKSKEIYYNCTLPYFGSKCEYILYDYKSYYSSLDEIISDYYYYNVYEPTLLTCYIHLECNHGPAPSCLDWTEICNGKVDCLNGEDDEKYCWQLEIQECNENEFQCSNGQCIPITSVKDDKHIPDCLDGSDEDSPSFTIEDELYFNYDDNTCARLQFHPLDLYSMSSCIAERRNLIIQAMFSIKPNLLSNECWSAMKCILRVPIADNSICSELCSNEVCNKIIQMTCPDIILVPALPILFGHIYLAYEKKQTKMAAFNRALPPQHACYNYHLLDLPIDKKSFLLTNNTECRYPPNAKYTFVSKGVGWYYYVKTTAQSFWKFQSLVSQDSGLCDRTNMYQCIKSSKCISVGRLFDGVEDCVYGDDEGDFYLDLGLEKTKNFNRNCSSKQVSNYFKCIRTNECVPYRTVKNNICDCAKDNDDYCEDEQPDTSYLRNNILFQTICDGFTHLLPQIIEGQHETDETNCEQWPLIHIYNHCNGFWNFIDDFDKINCYLSPLLNCSANHHTCKSFLTYQLMCLTIGSLCTKSEDCNGIEDKQICKSSNITTLDINEYTCNNWYESIDFDITNKYCEVNFDSRPRQNAYFVIDQSQYFVKQNVINKSIDIFPHQSSNQIIQSYQPRCHRGLDLQVWLDKEKELTTSVCLCPPTYYGEICQYQNERVSLTLQFHVTPDSVQIPFIIIVSLIDDNDERIIHSYEQFTYLSIKNCLRKYNIYLLYSTRPKDKMKNYSIHIDIYEKETLYYRGSIIKSFNFTFLPVHRLAFQIDIPPVSDNLENYSKDQCINGKSIKYFNDKNNRTFCQCFKGWSGQYCTIKYTSLCSSDSLYIGKLANNRSLCVCPLNKMGPRCLIDNNICKNNKSITCFNKGKCIPMDEYGKFKNKFACICPRNFTGDQCEIVATKLIMIFDKNIILPPSIIIHFIEIKIHDFPIRTTTYKKLSTEQNSTIIYWSIPFHIVFVELLNKIYYLTVVQKIYKQSSIIEKTINSSNQCLNINQLFNKTIANYSPIRRIKYYHLPCQNQSSQLLCFYDERQFCLCQQINQQRVANCFEFDHNMNRNGSDKTGCLNGGQIFQEYTTCPRVSICICPVCFYGVQCQFSTSVFSLSLDAILGYHIKPNINISHQPFSIIISLILTLIITLFGFINSILLIITFKNKITRESGCGIYLLTSSIIILLIMIIFLFKFLILLFSQMGSITNRTFLNIQCYSIDFILQSCLRIDQWLTAFIAIERVFIVIKGVNFNKNKSKLIAKWTIICLLLITILTNIFDPIHRSLFEENDDEDEKRIWCILKYSSTIRIINLIINILHFIVPFIINLISAIIIIIMSAKQRAAIQKKQKYKTILNEQIKQHKNLLIGPCVLIILCIPRLIISLTSNCMKSSSDSWLFLLGYFISLIPPLVTFILFVLPSTTYKQAFKKAISQYRNIIRRH